MHKKIIGFAFLSLFVCSSVFAGSRFDTFHLENDFSINVSHMKCATIHLEKGEMTKTGEITVSDRRWMVKANEYGKKRKVIIVKAPGKDTEANLIISTNKRVYNLDLVSDPKRPYIENVRFEYPAFFDPDKERIKSEETKRRKEREEAMSAALLKQAKLAGKERKMRKRLETEKVGFQVLKNEGRNQKTEGA